MTVASSVLYSTARPHILVPPASDGLLPEELAAMMTWLPNCLRLRVPAVRTAVSRVRRAARGHVLDVLASGVPGRGRARLATPRRGERCG